MPVCGSCRNWKLLGLPPRKRFLGKYGFPCDVEVRDCAALAGRGGEQREDSVACGAFKEREAVRKES